MNKKPTDEEIKNMYVYALHIILYANDMARFAIMDLKPYMKNKDKQSKKIFKALMKRVDNYYVTLHSALTENDDMFYADFNEVFDDCLEKDVKGFRRSAEWIFKCNGFPEPEFLSLMEKALSFTQLAITTYAAFKANLSYYDSNLKVNNLPKYNIVEIANITSNLYEWEIFMTKMKKKVYLSKKKSIKKYFENIKSILFDSKIFEKAYKIALDGENKRKQK